MFRVGFARVCYGSGPFTALGRSAPGDSPVSEEDTAPRIFCEVYPSGPHSLFSESSTILRQLTRHLGKKPAGAELRRHDGDGLWHANGVSMRGSITAGEIPGDEAEKAEPYVDISCLLPSTTFDAIVSALIAGGKDLLARCSLSLGLMDDAETIDFSKKEGALDNVTYPVDDIALTFDIGTHYEVPEPSAE